MTSPLIKLFSILVIHQLREGKRMMGGREKNEGEKGRDRVERKREMEGMGRTDRVEKKRAERGRREGVE